MLTLPSLESVCVQTAGTVPLLVRGAGSLDNCVAFFRMMVTPLLGARTSAEFELRDVEMDCALLQVTVQSKLLKAI